MEASCRRNLKISAYILRQIAHRTGFLDLGVRTDFLDLGVRAVFRRAVEEGMRVGRGEGRGSGEEISG